ncbi:DUF2007 domain-containing protein [Photobacterium japonica]
MNEPWCKVYSAANMLEAHSLKGLLLAHNIDAQTRGDGLSAAAGELPANVVEVSVWVRQSRQGLARSVLQDYEQAAEWEWQCPQCGEDNAGSFEICWQCGAEHPSL